MASPMFDGTRVHTVLCDLDGVVWLSHRPIDGAVEAIDRLRQSGRRVLFVTNNSGPTVAEHEAALASVGITAVGDVVSSAMAGAFLVEPGERVLVAGGAGIVEAVEERGAVAVINDGSSPGAVDAVIVGLHRDFDYAKLAAAATAARDGARLIGTNGDTTFPTPNGLLPGGGALLAAVAAAAGVEPVLGGKPHRPMAELIIELLSTGTAAFGPDNVLMVGDRPGTDGLFASRLGCPFALVRTGVVAKGAAVDARVRVSVDVEDLAAVADLVVGTATGDDVDDLGEGGTPAQ